MSWIIWARSGVIVAPLLVGMCRRSALRGRRDGATIRDAWERPRTSARPEEPQPSIEGESWKEGEGVESDAGAGRGHKKTAAQRLSTTLRLSRARKLKRSVSCRASTAGGC